MTIMYVWLVKCPTCKEAIRLENKTAAKRAYSQHLKKCSDVESPVLIESPYVGT